MSIATFVPAAVVAPPTRTPLPFGLFSVLPFRGGADRWEGGGVTWVGDTCAPADGIGGWNCVPVGEPGAPIGLPKTLDQGNSVGEASQFTVYGNWACSPVGTSPQEAQERANRHLLGREESRVEQALWTGDLGNVPNFAGANGFPAPDAVAAAGGILASIGALEDWLGQNYGAQGVLHMTRAMATRAVKNADAEMRGGRLYTALGTPIVAGAGYGVGGPAATTIVATGAMLGYRSEIFDSSARPGDLLDRSQNDLVAVAERNYLVGFEDCGFASITVGSDGGGGTPGLVNEPVQDTV